MRSGCCSVAQLCPTLFNPMDCSTPGFPVLHYLPGFAQTRICWVDDAIQPFHPLLPPSPPALNLSQHQDLFQWVSSLYQVAKVLEQYSIEYNMHPRRGSKPVMEDSSVKQSLQGIWKSLQPLSRKTRKCVWNGQIYVAISHTCTEITELSNAWVALLIFLIHQWHI